MISVLILTRNEEQDLPGCLASVAWSDDVHVFDSMSTDRTAEIAREHGAHFTQRAFDNYARQRNAALETLPFRHAWVFILDADERPTPALAEEMRQIAAQAPESIGGFRMRRRDFLNGTWLKHAQLSPFYIRLVRRGRARYVRDVNEILEIDGEVGDLREMLDHFPFSKGITHWTQKHNTYSTMEAQVVAAGVSRTEASWKTALFGRDFHERRRAQKAIFYGMPGRPLIKWCYMMFVRGAVLDGAAGITYANLQAIYEYTIVLKTQEIMRGSQETQARQKTGN
ncbi:MULTISPECIES: glycosyltransferase family 2 protein [Acidobacterium]|uniref:Glycosyl transferase, group 2 family n=1 Tax=Acidobacterium capsulatum (strain ATCC 51196 / DSM 11244 / BCRC 80197 / JCM 7670 / NBRC 15755 / NCIMB 13165 / 161) TaxID=240015 RepID=C1F657_ACIC5|nr:MULTISPECIES: glycosyltransferase family 2 protein [Acidobacterium]ACO33347.1 glycosyl transferase, group 2 family [Acidobacterium capsulatum ATCC 51196]HCT60854.1 glycosyltransferase family 2 protein [Acidobacterium sp.]